jgi:acetoin utilization deacetylase AcuC-like enzyme
MHQRKRTDIFLPYFESQRLIDFPQALTNILDKENVHYYDSVYQIADATNYVQPVTEDMLSEMHSKGMTDSVKNTGYFEAASYSAGGTVQAAKQIHLGNIDFTGFGDHHAGRSYFGGMCYFNSAAVAIAVLREAV